jgi:hypothetical protein
MHIKILLVFMKTLTNFKDLYGSRIVVSVPALLSVIGRFSLVCNSHWIPEKFV